MRERSLMLVSKTGRECGKEMDTEEINGDIGGGKVTLVRGGVHLKFKFQLKYNHKYFRNHGA